MTGDLKIHSYPSIYALGHRAISGMLDGDVVVEEKIDGSQFSFANLGGELCCRSKGKQLVVDAPEKMFALGVETVRDLFPLLTPGWVYRGEYLQKPKHNCLAYDRVPTHNIILYDVSPGLEEYLSPEEKQAEAVRLGLEFVPCFFTGRVDSMERLDELLETESCLGGGKVEGVVLKRYDLFTTDKKVMMGKYVSEGFKERNMKNWKKENKTPKDVVALLTANFGTEARWEKAVQHLRDGGDLEGSPRDIGKLIQEIPNDVLKEEEEYIKDVLFAHAWPHIKRGLVSGLPEWYKRQLAESAMEEK